jgi:hypothetical protein
MTWVKQQRANVALARAWRGLAHIGAYINWSTCHFGNRLLLVAYVSVLPHCGAPHLVVRMWEAVAERLCPEALHGFWGNA